MPAWMLLYGGDFLWAASVYGTLATMMGKASPRNLLALSMTLCLGVELSQLVSSPWLENGRSHTLLRFLLGQGFLWSDLACYLGVLGACIDGINGGKNEPFQWEGSFFTVVALS